MGTSLSIDNVETTDSNSYIPSIARQLAGRHSVHDRLKQECALVDCISSDQAASLLIDALRVTLRLDLNRPAIVTVNALDETDRKRLKETAVLLPHPFEGLPEYPHFKVFVSSRTENDIQTPLRA